ncbi:curli production assembly/transport protein CsgE [Aestuariibacter sp. AA17]|uniref:Curli production assembly/transport component CsgE n=1 Tax=Fluctibacter corallii TaxID=2984329 RepID=A0ABT3A8R9_9ALTE|nr:curli production assembly/transport protein CsgE [Aestuariibacter sp. AA17]MCV2885049.1 curli production assembly/transport protein CsgE [Aestuariibacter sp. AA17]
MLAHVSSILIAWFLLTSIQNTSAEEILLSGLLINNSISRQGHEFAIQFGQYWRDIPNTSGNNVRVQEIVVPQAGTKLTVFMNNKAIYQTYLGRRQTPLKDKVESAVLKTVEAIATASNAQSSPDLAVDEWK